ncbi:GntR family transcriptional regulator [Herbidospora sp. NEAU-GS84]|uniref:GntR family transcriptional regulator n=1 Tax=Herbidospora solisilvae TaxID=2696284 RepID=A0A7C9J1N5_9ACTN|nr:GntR family transcriptional regulator [Herbidospora solisilvae]NAS21986.1 GntR family transcriptional regulator [Herbidospora solisilvae]
MTEPAYVSIAGEYAQRIRKGELPPRVQLPSLTEIASQHGVSEIVVRKAVELLQSQGLVRSVPRRGVFVADRPNLVRVSPERQMEGAERTVQREANRDAELSRESEEVPATKEQAEVFGLAVGEPVKHVITRISDDGRPVSISDTYHPLDVTDISEAAFLEEAVRDELPSSLHGEWLRTTPGDLVKVVRQRYITADGRVIMISDVSYPRDRYDAFVFRMALK